jgi:uncharacterized protein YfiM (DUF2279 family)
MAELAAVALAVLLLAPTQTVAPSMIQVAPAAPAGAGSCGMRNVCMRAQQQPVPVQVTDAWFASDKLQHFGMSFAVTAFAFAGARVVGMERDPALRVAVPVAAVAGVGKEISDRRRGDIFSVRDLVADALGITAAFFLLREVR